MTTAANTGVKAGALARLTAGFLADAGLSVAGPDPDDADGRRLFIWTPGGPYSLIVSDDANTELQGSHDDPHRAADTAAALLSPNPSAARHPRAVSGEGITFKGIAGMDLKAKGFDVTLDIYTDQFYNVSTEIAVTSPDADAGTVYVDDEGGLSWCRDLWAEYAETEGGPGTQFRWHLPDPAAVARDIAGTVSRALSAGHDLPAACLPPPGGRPPRDGGRATFRASPPPRPIRHPPTPNPRRIAGTNERRGTDTGIPSQAATGAPVGRRVHAQARRCEDHLPARKRIG